MIRRSRSFGYPRPIGGRDVAVSDGWPPIFVIIGIVIPIGSLVAGRFCPVEDKEG